MGGRTVDTDRPQRPSVEFTITLDDVEYPVVFDGGPTPPYKVAVNGRLFTVEVEEGGEVLVDGIAYHVALEEGMARVGEESYPLKVTGLSLAQEAASEVDLPVRAGLEAGAGAVVAIMPGKITRVMVAQGQEVKKGEAVCVLEAMKMENELRAERDGIVKAVHVEAGDDVEKDQVLVEVGARGVDHGAA